MLRCAFVVCALWLVGCGRTAPFPDGLAQEPCENGVADGDETDVDCGGPSCAPCARGRLCARAEDCLSEVCTDLWLWSDQSWKQTREPGSDWQRPEHDDARWLPAVEQAEYGAPPWLRDAPMPARTPARWIWYADSRHTHEETTVYFRRALDAPNAQALTVTVTGDNRFGFYVDGAQVAHSDWWYTPRTVHLPVTPYGRQTLAVWVRNVGTTPAEPHGPGGLLVDVRGAGPWCH